MVAAAWKVWRAFRELDGLPDEECRRVLARAMANTSTLARALPGLVFWATLMLVPVALWRAIIAWGPTLAPLIPDDFATSISVMGLIQVISATIARCAAIWLRSYSALARELRRETCPKCRSSLMGLPITAPGTEPDPAQNRVKCPECGRVWRLLDLGLTPRDLIPWEQRGMDPSAGRLRRRDAD
jgi:hypothetical protein